MRARDLGIAIGRGVPGPANAITDIPGVRVGHTTLIRGDGPLRVGNGPVRTGVTVLVPHDGDVWSEPLFAGCHTLNGNGELTGTEWIRDSGLLTGLIAITNTHSVGIVRDALAAHPSQAHLRHDVSWSLPVVGETYDGLLSDMNGHHVRAEHVDAAYAAAAAGAVAEGGFGGGTGSVCHEFKGGIGTSSRVLAKEAGGWTVGVLVQANFGRRDLLRIDGVRVGEAIPTSLISSPYAQEAQRAESGSIIAIVATDAPLLPGQCRRVAERVGMGIARTGSIASTTSGDLFLAFATGNRGLPAAEAKPPPVTLDVRMVAERALDPVFEATIEATEEAIVNALVAAQTMVGRDGITAHRLPARAAGGGVAARGSDVVMPGVALRPATVQDVPAMEHLMLANEHGAPGEAPPPAGTQAPYLAHLVVRGTVVVAELEGALVGFGASANTGRTTHLADLFVKPSRHGHGIGKALLANVMGDAWPRSTFASSDPAAVPLYVRAGMVPLWTNFYVSGDPSLLPPAAPGYVVEPVPFEEVSRLERDWIGADRGPELAYWARFVDARPVVVRAPGGEIAATGITRRRHNGVGRWSNQFSAAPSADRGPALYAALRHGLQGAEVGGACVPGPSALLPMLLQGGFRIRDQDTFLASDPGLVDPTREIVNTGLL